jgi:hypothetical protein
MYKAYIIQNIITKEYWYGFYTNKTWTIDSNEAKYFDTKKDAKEFIKLNESILNGIYIILKIWYKEEYVL